MAKKKKSKQKHKPFRNAGAPRPRASTAKGAPDDDSLKRLAYTAGGAGGVALAGAFLAHEGWKPKTIATALGITGAALAWKAGEETMQSVGAGAMSAAAAQLALLMLEDHDAKAKAEGRRDHDGCVGAEEASRKAAAWCTRERAGTRSSAARAVGRCIGATSDRGSGSRDREARAHERSTAMDEMTSITSTRATRRRSWSGAPAAASRWWRPARSA